MKNRIGTMLVVARVVDIARTLLTVVAMVVLIARTVLAPHDPTLAEGVIVITARTAIASRLTAVLSADDAATARCEPMSRPPLLLTPTTLRNARSPLRD
jgi:hypothetical protein